MSAVADPTGAPTTEIGTTLPNPLPSWADYGRANGGTSVIFNDFEYVDEWRWPRSVKDTIPRMMTDSQLKALERGTFLPITNYAWGIDPNGADPKMVDAACADFNLLRIEDALIAAQTGKSPVPIGRARNRFVFHRHLAQSLKALRYGNYPFEQVGEIRDDGRRWGAPQDLFWHLKKLAPRPPRSLIDIRAADDGGLLFIVQRGKGLRTLRGEPIDVGRLVYYVWDPEEDPGDWLGTSMLRSVWREWLSKDRLLRIDVRNHEKAGGSLLLGAPEGATQREREALGQMAAQFTSGGGGSVPEGTVPTFIRGTGSEVIGSINRHDEAMSRAWMMMLIQLASTAHGSRAVGNNFESLLGIFQEGIAGWACDTFNEHVIEDWCDWNYGPDTEQTPRLAFIRPKDLDPSGALDPEDLAVAKSDPVVKAAIADAVSRRRAARSEDARPARATISLPGRRLRRDPYDHEVRAATDFGQVDANWQSQVDLLVSQWQTIRAAQIAELTDAITAAGGDLTGLTQITATAAGGDLIAARLKQMAQLGAAEAVSEAARQGVPASTPAIAELEAELESRGAALEQLLASALQQAAANKAVQITGPSVAAEEVAGQVADYLNGLTDTYLNDQFSGALSAAQNAGRLAAMSHNGASTYYASELLDTNTCEPCEEIDGTEYASADDAAKDYPAGGFRDCAGGPRCRGTVVAVYEESEPSS